MREKIEKSLTLIFIILCASVFVVLWICSFVATGKNGSSEYVYFTKDFPLWNILGMTIFLSMVHVLGGMSKYLQKKRSMDILAVIISLICMLFSIYWVGASNTAPDADQAKLVKVAIDFAQGDFSELEKGNYMAVCQHQLGMVTLIRFLFALFRTQYYRVVQYFNACMVPLLIFSGYQVVKKLSEDNRKTELIYLFLMMICFPMYGFVPFVYGQISSTTFIMLAAWMLLDCLQDFHWWNCVILFCATALAYQFKQNAVIMIIGFGIVLLVKLIVKPSWKLAVVGLCIVLGPVLSQMGIHALYAPHIAEDAKSIPAVLYIAMGTHETYWDAPGWFDGYNHIQYGKSNYDPEAAKEAATQEIKKFVDKCIDQPEYALHFYGLKMNTQWNAPMYQCLAINKVFAGEQSFLAHHIYFGLLGRGMVYALDIYQLIIYGGVLYLLVLRGMRMERYVLMIGIYGGFLFSLLWEANTRYVFPYMIFMIPYAAMGTTEALKGIGKIRENFVKRLKEAGI